jgi:hypothetical protein
VAVRRMPTTEEQLTKTKVYPNPSLSQTTIEFSVGESEKVMLEVYNAEGRLVSVLANEVLNKGRYKKVFEPSGVGLFTYRLNIGERTETGKIVIGR